MSKLRRQVLRRDLVEEVAPIVDRVGTQQAPPTPEMHGGDHDTVVGRDVLRGQQALREQARKPIGKLIDMAKPPDTCSVHGVVTTVRTPRSLRRSAISLSV